MCKNLSSSMFAKKMKRTIILKNLEEKKLQIKKSKIIMSFLLKKKKKSSNKKSCEVDLTCDNHMRFTRNRIRFLK